MGKYTEVEVIGTDVREVLTGSFIAVCGMGSDPWEMDEGNAERIALCWNQHDKLVEALEDIARGSLQEPDFIKYAVNKAKQALKG